MLLITALAVFADKHMSGHDLNAQSDYNAAGSRLHEFIWRLPNQKNRQFSDALKEGVKDDKTLNKFKHWLRRQ